MKQKKLSDGQRSTLGMTEDLAAQMLTEDKIEYDMQARDIKFDLSGEYAYKVVCGDCRADIKEYQTYDAEIDQTTYICGRCGAENTQNKRRVVYGRKIIFTDPKLFWKEFETTNQVLVPKKFEHWLIGQEKALKEFREQLEEWVRKLKFLTGIKKSGKKLSAILKEQPGPYILMVGLPGTGKSLIIKIIAQDLERLYKEHGISLYDVVAFKNKHNPYKPNVHLVPEGMGNKLIDATYDRAVNKGKTRQTMLRAVFYSVVLIGLCMLFVSFYIMYSIYPGLVDNGVSPGDALAYSFASVAQLLGVGATMVIFPFFILMFRNMTPGAGGQGFAAQVADDIPNVLVDNDPKSRKLYVDATVTNQAKLTGDIIWSAYGDTAGISQPHHRRINAGLVHEANMKVLFWDEFKNLTTEMGVELLTVMENGETPIRGHQGMGTAHTASQNVESPPIPALFLLVAAANDDIIDDRASILNRLPALRDRFRYGNTIYMDSEVPATEENKIKFVQAITDELYRFNFPPMSKEACEMVIRFAQRHASSKNMISLQFRSMIQMLKKSAQFAWLDENEPEGKEVIRPQHIQEALKAVIPVEEQKLMQHIEKVRAHKLMRTKGVKIGAISGLAVITSGADVREMVGDAFPVAAHIQKVDSPEKASFKATGIRKDQEAIVADSVEHVQTAINMMYGMILDKEYRVRVSFSQQHSSEGDSAGVAMTLAIMSRLGDPRLPPDERKPIPLRRDFAVTGAIEILTDDEYDDDVNKEIEKGETAVQPDGTLVRTRSGKTELDLRGRVPLVAAIGGAYAKIAGAARNGIGNVVIPYTNYTQNVDSSMVNEEQVTVFGARNILDYFELLRADRERPADRKPVKRVL